MGCYINRCAIYRCCPFQMNHYWHAENETIGAWINLWNISHKWWAFANAETNQARNNDDFWDFYYDYLYIIFVLSIFIINIKLSRQWRTSLRMRTMRQKQYKYNYENINAKASSGYSQWCAHSDWMICLRNLSVPELHCDIHGTVFTIS